MGQNLYCQMGVWISIYPSSFRVYWGATANSLLMLCWPLHNLPGMIMCRLPMAFRVFHATLPRLQCRTAGSRWELGWGAASPGTHPAPASSHRSTSRQADLAMGVMSGPLSPVNPKTGKTVSVMAVDCMLAGPLESRFLMMYWITQKRPFACPGFLIRSS